MKTRFENNYAATLVNLAAYVLENAPRGLRPNDKARLQTVMEAPEDASYFSNIEFSRANNAASCTLYAELSGLWAESKTDEEGNLWREHELEVKISYPTYGSCTPTTAALRAQLIADVAAFAGELQAAFAGKVWSLVATKAERDAAALKAAEAKRVVEGTNAGRDSLRAYGKGLKAGQSVTAIAVTGAELAGSYPFEVGERRYEFLIEGGFGSLKRLA